MTVEVLSVEDRHLDTLAIERTAPDVVSVTTVVSGAEALALLNRGMEPRVVLLDLNLPGMSGFEVLAGIRQGRLPRVPVVVFSTSADPDDVAQAESLGASAYIRKPRSLADYSGVWTTVRHTMLVAGDTDTW